MSILVNKDTRVIVQGFTGSQATLHSEQAIEYGTNIVGGITPGKGGQTHLGKPVFDTMDEAVKSVQPNASLIFVPAPFCKDSILEAAESGIELIVCLAISRSIKCNLNLDLLKLVGERSEPYCLLLDQTERLHYQIQGIKNEINRLCCY